MGNLKHTPGEWWACCTKAKPHYVFTKDCELVICSIIQKQELSTDLPLEQVQANAKLIAAAPELLEALQGICNILEITSLSNKPTFKEDFMIAQAAIKKAIGYEQNSN